METKKFNEMYDSGETFYQLTYYDRTKGYSCDRKSKVFATKEEAEKTIKEMKKENERLFAKMLDTYKQHGVTKDNYKDNILWNDMKVDCSSLNKSERLLFRFHENNVGYCFLSLHERNREREIREDEKAREEG